MLTHHLTITQNKFFYVSLDCKSLYISEGLNPLDAEKYELIPVIALTISVEGAGIYHQKLFIYNEEISLADFLYDAWSNNPLLGGLPDCLHTDKHLSEEYPLHEVVQKLDPNGHVKKIITKHNQKFGGSKAQAHNLISTGLSSLDRGEVTEVKTINEMLEKINESYLEYTKQIIPLNLTENKIKRQVTQETLVRIRNLPERIESACDRQSFTESWVSQAAYAIPQLTENQSLTVSHSNKWLEYLDIYNEGEEIQPSNSSFRSEHYRWIDELKGIVDTMKSLPFSPLGILPEDVSDEVFNNFLSGRNPLETTTADQLEANLFDLPMVLFPKTKKMMVDGYDYISHGGDLHRAFEIYSRELPDLDYRIVFGEVCYDQMFSIIIKKETSAYNTDLNKALINLDGKIDIGPAGMTCLLYFIETFNELNSYESSRIFIEMLETMLDSVSEWSSRD